GWSNASGPIKTSSLEWTPLSPTRPTGVPGGVGIGGGLDPNGSDARSGQPFFPEIASSTGVSGFADGVTYCVRVRALSDDSFRENDNASSRVLSQWSQIGSGENAAAFTYQAPLSPTSDPVAPVPQLAAPNYLEPIATTVTRTPLLRWNPVLGARRYFVIIARDSNFTNVIDAAFTAMTAYAPNWVLEDEATSYFYAVIPAARSDGAGISGGPRQYSPQTFNKLSLPPGPMEPVGGVDVTTQPTFRWTPTDGAQKYRIQVSADPQFGELLNDVTTSSTAYTSSTPYPVDTVLYWRVRAEQLQVLKGSRVDLRWSDVGSFRRRLPAPALAADIPLKGELPPALTWTPVPGAISYDLHIDQADGQSNDFNVKSPAGTFTRFFGIGTFKYRVRANFAARSGEVASAYSAPRDFTRIISPPPGPRVTRSKTRLTFGWGPAAAATSYQVDVSTSESFSNTIESARTNNTSWAPTLASPVYQTKAPLYWRVATVDDGGNVGAFITAQVRAGRKMTVHVTGRLRRNARSRIKVSVRGSGKALRSASVRASGAGVVAITKRTGKSGTTSLSLRPTKKGSVTLSVKHTGYADKTVTVKVH
ncbi:MAG: large repetitive protein, partial [Gaiellaceae bacterium]|nr:large repetitive protein [Gaiellaceae bacterium]